MANDAKKLSFLWRSCISICDRSSDRISDSSGNQGTNIPGGMILAILLTTLAGIPFGVTHAPESIFAFPAGIGHQFLKVDFMGALNFAYIPFLIALFVPDFFSTFGTFWEWEQRQAIWIRRARWALIRSLKARFCAPYGDGGCCRFYKIPPLPWTGQGVLRMRRSRIRCALPLTSMIRPWQCSKR